ncbi:MAG: hypothetical protein Terrestrivirus1_205 [Terrestrivirus sp.]|uniref:Uncharacterized protein n=1 Tax=Terrestrivirus sp. TaxID=2487775 RepID=A0A3G4ZMQ8_9VIRU|nr:MAG: hypothetical protein Terrestrivirus1_205 [Terrestrivirus sp.]
MTKNQTKDSGLNKFTKIISELYHNFLGKDEYVSITSADADAFSEFLYQQGEIGIGLPH